MNRKHLAILATAALVWSVSPVHAVDGMGPPTDVSAANKKKKGKGGTKGGEQYMTIKMENTMVTSYRSQGGRPKGPSGGLLGFSNGNFSPNPPAPTGTPVAPPSSRGGGIR